MEHRYSIFMACCHSWLERRQNSSWRANLRSQPASLGREQRTVPSAKAWCKQRRGRNESSTENISVGQSLYFTMKFVQTLQDTCLKRVERIKQFLYTQ